MLDFYSIILDLEEVFHLPIPDSESRRFLTVSFAPPLGLAPAPGK